MAVVAPEREFSTIGVVGGLGAVIVGIHFVIGPFLMPAIRRCSAPYVPANASLQRKLLQYSKRYLQSCSGSVKACHLVDIGSGDGCIVHAAAQEMGDLQCHFHGIELNPWLVWWSRFKAMRLGVSGKTSFYLQNLWKADLSRYDVLLFVGTPDMVDQLVGFHNQHICDLQFTRFPLNHWKPKDVLAGQAVDGVWIYEKN